MLKPKTPIKNKLKFLFISSLFIVLIIALINWDAQNYINHSVQWMRNFGVLAPIIFIIIYNLATLLFIPGSVLTIKGGFLFGIFWGSIYVLMAAILGAICAFLIGRYLSRDWISRQLEYHPKFKAIDQAVAKEGWKIVLLTRLSPLFPFNLLNYAFGITQVSLKDYILGSLGILPGTIMYVYIGAVASDISMLNTMNLQVQPQMQVWQGILQGLGLLATIGITVYITKISQKALNQSIYIREQGTGNRE
ncbi:MAG TPA: TVP38/TMEM64 family protein [Nostocaceae cyanobacterium]|nr:TVP38/TMEM64 family protein [Nostocaceae cyanobacterium]